MRWNKARDDEKEGGGIDREPDWNPVIYNFDRAADTEKSPYLSGRLSFGYTGKV